MTVAPQVLDPRYLATRMKLLRLDVVISRAPCVLKTLCCPFSMARMIILLYCNIVHPACCTGSPENLRPSPVIADFFCPCGLALLKSKRLFTELNPRLIQSKMRKDSATYNTTRKSKLCWRESVLLSCLALYVRWPDP